MRSRTVFKDVSIGFARVESMLVAINDVLASDEEMKQKLTVLERKHIAWAARISQSQLDLLALVPHTPLEVKGLWSKAKECILPESTELEFRFRLHELEGLGLVARRRGDDVKGDWLYWRAIPGRT